MFLLAVIAVAILPALWQGIRYSARAIVRRDSDPPPQLARRDGPRRPDLRERCAAWTTLPTRRRDGRGGTLTPRFNPSGDPACPTGSRRTVTFTLEIVGAGQRVQASTTSDRLPPMTLDRPQDVRRRASALIELIVAIVVERHPLDRDRHRSSSTHGRRRRKS